jgi:beta-mannosidase
VVSWSVLDHERVPKLGWDALRHACAPVIVVADRPPEVVAPGEAISLDVHVVNDRRTPIDSAVVDITASWSGGTRRWRFGGDVDDDTVARVGSITLDVPDTLGALTFDLVLTADGLNQTNHYSTAVTVLPDWLTDGARHPASHRRAVLNS